MPEDSPFGGITRGPLASARGLVSGIRDIRRSLEFGEHEQRVVQEAGERLRPYIEGWVDAFYTRLLTDPVAMRVLDDDARVIRLKRSLTAWFHELFSLPFDEHFERLREAIGKAHVRVEMPTYLMITAMSRLRQDVLASVREEYAAEPVLARQVGRAVALALDVELALITMAFRRTERAQARRQDRLVYAQRAARRFAHILLDRIDAALCYAELAAESGPRQREGLTKLRDVLRGLSRFDHRMQARVDVQGLRRRRVRLSELCARGIADVSLGREQRVYVDVDPPDLEAVLVAEAVQLAVEELVQNAAAHAPGGTLLLECAAGDPDGVVIRVMDEGPGWPPSVREIKDIYALGTGLGLSFCEVVAELHGGSIDLFTAPSGGAGVHLHLRSVGPEGEPA